MESQSDLIKKGDWNTLIILDACRYDTFKKILAKPEHEAVRGTLKKVRTDSKDTPEWYINNWVGEKGTEDAILISANPQSFRYGDLKFKASIRAWGHMAPALKVIAENTMMYYLSYAMGQRAVVHFIPPHLPYLGTKGAKLNAKIGINPIKNPSNVQYSVADKFTEYGQKNGWDEIIECYEENLELVLPLITVMYADYLAPVVITSDHGQCLGEGNKFGHSHKEPELRDVQTIVPWFEYNDDEIRNIVRLRELGYFD